MTEFKLYPHQQATFSELLIDIFNGRSPLVQYPTGGGKTHIAAHLAKVTSGKVIWFICHRAELVGQAARVFDEMGVVYGTVTKRGVSDPDAAVQICMVGSLPRRVDQLRRPDILMFDECHHIAARTWHKITEEFDGAVRVGLTATPYRLDGAALEPYFSRIIEGPSVRLLIEQGYLSDFVYYAPTRPDLSDVRVNRSGEFDQGQLEKVMTTDVIVGDVIDHYNRLAPGRKAIVYAVSVDASKDIALRFNRAGIPAAHIDGDTPEDERKAKLEALANGEIKVVTNVELFTEGLDLPDVGAVILMRPTRSLGLARQMVGRGLRVGSNENLIILDHANLFAEFGTPDFEFEWRLDGKPPKWKGEGHKRSPLAGRVLDGGAREIEYVLGTLERVAGTPKGCETQKQFSIRIKSDESVVSAMIKRGMPVIYNGKGGRGNFVFIDEALDWVKLNASELVKRRAFGLPIEGKKSFCKRVGVSFANLHRLIKRGMPVIDDRHVDPCLAEKWLSENWSSFNFTPKNIAMSNSCKLAEINKERSARAATDGYAKLAQRGRAGAAAAMAMMRANIPYGYEIKGKFCARVGVQRDTLRRWICEGLPTSDCGKFIHIESGEKWVDMNHPRTDCGMGGRHSVKNSRWSPDRRKAAE